MGIITAMLCYMSSSVLSFSEKEVLLQRRKVDRLTIVKKLIFGYANIITALFVITRQI